MSFKFDSDDDDDFSTPSAEPTTTKNLSSLFSADQSLTSVKSPPQQPKKEQPAQTTVYHYATVNLYKYSETGTFENQGRVGAAIVYNPANNVYQLLCYRSPKDYVLYATIRGNQFSYTVQNGQYGSFYDDARQLWSLLFKAADEAFFFAIHIGFAKHLSDSNTNTVSFVDLQEGTGNNVVEQGSKVSVKYTGWLLNDVHTGTPKLGKSFDSNASSGKPLRFKIGENKVIQGWEKGLLGMKKQGGAKRFIVVPPALGYGDKSIAGIPANSTLCFQVELVKVSSRKESASTPELPSQAVLNNTQQPDVKSRMAKLGVNLLDFQSMGKTEEELPADAISFAQQPNAQQSFVQQSPVSPMVQPVVTQQPVVQQPLVQQPIVQQPVQQPIVQQPVQQQPAVQQQQPVVVQPAPQPAIVQSQQPVVQPVQSNQQQSSNVDISVFQQLLQQMLVQQKAEQQPVQQPQVQQPVPQPAATPQPSQQATPQSPSFDKIFTRLDEIASKIDNLDFNKIIMKKPATGDEKSVIMSGPMLLQNIQHLVAANEQQQKDLQAEREKVDQLIEKLSTLRKRNEKYAQEMSAHLNTSSVDTEYLHQELEHQQKQNQELKKKLASFQTMFDREREQQQDLENQVTQLTADKTALQKQYERSVQKSAKEELEHKQQIADLQEKAERQLAQQIANDKDKAQRLLEEIYDLKNKLGKAQEQLQEKDKNMTDSNEQFKARVEAAVQQKEQQMREFYEKKLVEMQEIEVDKVRNDYNAQIEQLNGQLATLTEQLQQKQAALDRVPAILEARIEEAENNKAAEIKAMFREQFQAKMKEIEEEKEQDQQEMKTLFKQKLQEQREQVEPAVKNLLTKMFMNLKKQVDEDKRYKGSKVVATVLGQIKQSLKQFVDYVKEGGNLAAYGDEEEEEQEVTPISDDEDEAPAPVVTRPVVQQEEKVEVVEQPVQVPVAVPEVVSPSVEVKEEQPVVEETPVEQQAVVKEEVPVKEEKAPVEVQEEVKPEEPVKVEEPKEEEPKKQEEVKEPEPAPAPVVEQPPVVEEVSREPPIQIPDEVEVDPLAELSFKEPEEFKTNEPVEPEPAPVEPPKPVLTEEEQRVLKEQEMQKKKAKTAHLFADDDDLF